MDLPLTCNECYSFHFPNPCRFNGGVVLVSHDERLISLIADELWVVQKGKGGNPGNVSIFQGDFEAYRKQLQEELEAEGLI